MKVVLCKPDKAFREIGRKRGVEGIREQRPALQLLERLDHCVGHAGRGGLDALGSEVAMAPCDVDDVCVVRKQFYISDEHERD